MRLKRQEKLSSSNSDLNYEYSRSEINPVAMEPTCNCSVVKDISLDSRVPPCVVMERPTAFT